MLVRIVDSEGDEVATQDFPSVQGQEGFKGAFIEEGGIVKTYTTLMLGGKHEEGAPIPTTASKMEACFKFFDALESFIGNSNRVVWRKRPLLEDIPSIGYSVRARLYAETIDIPKSMLGMSYTAAPQDLVSWQTREIVRLNKIIDDLVKILKTTYSYDGSMTGEDMFSKQRKPFP